MVISKRHLIIGFMLLCVLAVAISGLALQNRGVSVSATQRELPIYSVQSEKKAIALTFDAAWGAEDTQLLIDTLGKYSAKATFFVVGEWVDKYPEAVKSLQDAGHDVMNHSNTHPHMTELQPAQVLQEADQASDKIEAITGKRPDLLRVPYGDYNDTVVKTLREGGYEVIQWDVEALAAVGKPCGTRLYAAKITKMDTVLA